MATQRLIVPEALDFSGIIRAGDVVICGQAASEPRTLTRALIAQKDRLPPFTMFVGAIFSDTFAPERTEGIAFTSYGVIGNTAALAKAGRLAIVPSNYSALCADFASGRHCADVVLLQVSDRVKGRQPSTSLSCDFAASAAPHARTVIAEFHPDTPWTFGAELSPEIRFQVCVEANLPMIEMGLSPPDQVSSRIAEHVAGLVSDGATLQLGVGKIPDTILAKLSHLRDIGVHSGLISDAVIDLIEKGVVTNSRKGIDPGVTVSHQLVGTRRLYDWAHDNPALAVRDAAYTHSHAVIARLDRLISINSAIEVALDGSVNSETLNGVPAGATGGQVDFVRGANASVGGRAIIALPSTSSKGASRIVAKVETVTTPRCDVDAIVTEWGVAELRGCDLGERARRMIAIAAPEYREDLSRVAFSAR